MHLCCMKFTTVEILTLKSFCFAVAPSHHRLMTVSLTLLPGSRFCGWTYGLSSANLGYCSVPPTSGTTLRSRDRFFLKPLTFFRGPPAPLHGHPVLLRGHVLLLSKPPAIRHLSMSLRHLSVNLRHFSVGLRHFSVGLRHFSVGLRHFSVGLRHFSVALQPLSSPSDLSDLEHLSFPRAALVAVGASD